MSIATMVAGRIPYGKLGQAGAGGEGRAYRLDRVDAEQARRRAERTASPSRSAAGLWLTPGLIDCHTHLVYGGNRVEEFEKRLCGVPYEEIARAGGGIQSTVNATRRADFEELRGRGGCVRGGSWPRASPPSK